MSSLFQLESYFLRCRTAVGKVLHLHLTEMCFSSPVSQANATGHFLWPLVRVLSKGRRRREKPGLAKSY